MTYKGMVCINGTWIPTMAELDFSVEDIDIDSGRTADAKMHRKRIGKKIKLSCGWDYIPDTQEFYNLFNLLDNLPEYFTIVFPHPNGNNKYQIEAYRGNPLTTKMLVFREINNQKKSLWTGLKINFIER